MDLDSRGLLGTVILSTQHYGVLTACMNPILEYNAEMKQKLKERPHASWHENQRKPRAAVGATVNIGLAQNAKGHSNTAINLLCIC